MNVKTFFLDGHGECEVWELPKIAPSKQRQYYDPESYIHPAKMDVFLCRKIIKTYTQENELILDPMAGIGTTLIEGALLGRNTIGVELEEKFVRITQKNIERLEKLRTLSPKGKAEIIQGDARELSKLLTEKADSIVFSPPFERTLARENPNRRRGYWRGSGGYQSGRGTEDYGRSDGNIGNLKKETYLSAMLKVYSECYKVLKLGGRMVVVVKDFIRNKRVVRLDLDTKRLCEMAGFRWVETKLFRLPFKSFWRILYERKYGHEVENLNLLNYEFVEVFRK